MRKLINKFYAPLVCWALLALSAVVTFAPGCSTTTSTVTPASGTNAANTNIVTTSQALDPAVVAQIDAALAGIMSNAPAAIADAQAISALVHGTNK